MRLYIKSAINISDLPQQGSAPSASGGSSGYIKFNAGRSLELPNTLQIHLTTGKVLVDSRTGNVVTSMNVCVYGDDNIAQFYNYTPEEFKELYDYFSSLSREEANEEIQLYNRHYND